MPSPYPTVPWPTMTPLPTPPGGWPTYGPSHSPAPTAIPTSIQVDKGTLDSFNPLKIEKSVATDKLSQPGSLFSYTLGFLFPMAGLIMFVMLIVAGFEIMSGAATKKSIDTGKQRATAAIVGFLLLFASYWIIQIVQIVFNINILGK